MPCTLARMAQVARSIRTQLARALAALVFLSAQPAMADSPPGNALILFGAHWCAPCTAELRDLDAIMHRLAMVQGTQPQLVLAWIDRPVPPAMVTRLLDAGGEARGGAPHVVILPPATASSWAEPHLAKAHGLPFAVMTDAHGAVCALHQGAVRAETIDDLWATCHKGQ